eukprot:683907-Amphidinium_carterae.1
MHLVSVQLPQSLATGDHALLIDEVARHLGQRFVYNLPQRPAQVFRLSCVLSQTSQSLSSGKKQGVNVEHKPVTGRPTVGC